MDAEELADQQTHAIAVAARRAAYDEQEIDLIDYLLVIWRHRWMIALLTIAAMAVTVVLMLRTPRRYQAVATVLPPLEVLQKEGSAGGLGALGNSALRNIVDTGSIAGVYVEILQSREVGDTLIDRFDLMHVYEGVQFRSSARRQLAGSTKIDTTEGGAVKIAVTDLDPNRAAALANAYVKELDERNRVLFAGQATSKREFLETRLKEVEADLGRIDAIQVPQARTQQTIYEWLIRECELAKIEEARSMPTIQVLDAAVVPELPVGRGTVRKGMMAGMAALMFGIFVAFSREYAASARLRRAQLERFAAGDGDDTAQPAPRRGRDDIRRSDAPRPAPQTPAPKT